MNIIKLNDSFEYKIIYIFRINDNSHKGFLKIGDATIKTNKNYLELKENSRELNDAANDRIRKYTTTAGVIYDLLHTEIAAFKINDKLDKKFGLVKAFRDHDVHNVLKRSGITNKEFKLGKEWFQCDLNTAKNAIKAVKESRTSLFGKELTTHKSPVILRPEQEKAIKDTLKQFEKGDRMLWNAKMRFGKTLSALEVTKRSSFSRTIIITHRPVVEDGWFDDFNKIFYDKKDYLFGSKNAGEKLEVLVNSKNKFVYFASMQDLRGSEKVGGKYDKNNIIFKIDWDFVVVDEAHEGTQTKLGQDVLQEVIKPNNGKITKTLELSGTPFNLLVDYGENEIYTWDYIMEQDAKNNWFLNNFGDSNPYDELPKLNIFTFHLEENFKHYRDIEDKAFNFREFFRVWQGDIKKDGKHLPQGTKVGDFIHEQDVKSFLNLLTNESSTSNYPFSNETYREYFRHSLFVLPGVKEARALSNLLKIHKIFSQFEIVNVAGEGDEEIDISDALKAVRKAITKNPENTRTITITCGRLTTGVTVPEWTAVLMLSGSYLTSATQYLQTIFRVQSPANINGKIKENCYVFDFAPDRTLMMVAESVQLSQRGMGTKTAEARLKDFLNFCPVVSISNSVMQVYKVSELLQQLKKAYVERVVKNGFDDTKLYNDELLKLDNIQLKEFENLRGIIGQTKALDKTTSININDEGFTKEEYEKIEEILRKKKKELSEEEKALLEEKRKRNKQKNEAISILRGISIRIPLLVFGADIPLTKDISVEEFPNFVDEASWIEFMPKGVTKEIFLKFGKYYDKDIFIASTYRIRAATRAADDLEPTERILKISQIFSTFRNPDKETVLTPWKVVNMHLSDTIGGFTFYHPIEKNEVDKPIFVNQDGVTNQIFKDSGKVLEINSKTGLYPLYIAYTFYKNVVKDQILSFEDKLKIYDDVLIKNVFIICKTPMAKQITRRTLLGYRNGKINSHAFNDLVNQFKEKNHQFVKKITRSSFWGINSKENRIMKFNAIVGNPPYQQLTGGAQAQAVPLYNHFVTSSINLNPEYISLIMPSRWMTGGMGLDEFRQKMLSDYRIQIIHDYFDASECFSNVEIKGGVCYLLWNKNKNTPNCNIVTHDKGKIISKSFRPLLEDGIDIFIRNDAALSILRKVKERKEKSFIELISSQKPFGLSTNFDDYHMNRRDDDIKVYGNKFIGYVSSSYKISKNKELIKKYKILTPKAVGSGKTDDVINPIIAEPGSICTETYIVIGPFENKEKTTNVVSYIDTKFFHFLLTLKKNTQDCLAGVFSFIPIQDFSKKWNDEALYTKYNLDKDEINTIENLTNSKLGKRYDLK